MGIQSYSMIKANPHYSIVIQNHCSDQRNDKYIKLTGKWEKKHGQYWYMNILKLKVIFYYYIGKGIQFLTFQNNEKLLNDLRKECNFLL